MRAKPKTPPPVKLAGHIRGPGLVQRAVLAMAASRFAARVATPVGAKKPARGQR